MNVYQKTNTVDNGQLYVYLVDGSTNLGQYGYSAFGQPFMFLFADKHDGSLKDIAHTIAHEIGHAGFKLQHPIMLTSEANNLMESSAKVSLSFRASMATVALNSSEYLFRFAIIMLVKLIIIFDLCKWSKFWGVLYYMKPTITLLLLLLLITSLSAETLAITGGTLSGSTSVCAGNNSGRLNLVGKGIEWEVGDKINLQITNWNEPKLLPHKQQKLMAFAFNFKTNVFLPDFIGLGKGASFGFGTVKKMKSEK